MSLFKKIRVDFLTGKNLDLIISIPVIFVIIILSFFGIIKAEVVFAIIVFSLLILLINTLQVRYCIDEHMSEIRDSKSGSSYTSIHPQSFKEDLSTAREVVFIGNHFDMFFEGEMELLSNLLKNNSRLTFLLVNPKGYVPRMTAMRFIDSSKDLAKVELSEKMKIEDSIRTILGLKETYNDLISLKLIDYSLDYTAYFINSKILYLEHHTFRTRGGNNKPKERFCKRTESNSWYDLYKTEIHELLNASTDFDGTKNNI